MSHKLWKATFKPAYPVCDGELIFTTPLHIDWDEAAEIAKQELTSAGIEKLGDLLYLGELTPSVECHQYSELSEYDVLVISFQTGEY